MARVLWMKLFQILKKLMSKYTAKVTNLGRMARRTWLVEHVSLTQIVITLVKMHQSKCHFHNVFCMIGMGEGIKYL